MRSRSASFVDQLAGLRFENVFNPYADCCVEHDHAASAAIRRKNLTVVLEAAIAMGVESIWFGRDLGYRGGRRTGLALTDEPHLHIIRKVYRDAPVKQATATGPVAERTAHEIWKMVGQLSNPPFLWNIFPFHPHVPGEPMSNRCHTRREAGLCEDILDSLLRWLGPARIIALGKDAHRALSRLGHDSICIRHPSYAGQSAFAAGICQAYGLRSERDSRCAIWSD